MDSERLSNESEPNDNRMVRVRKWIMNVLHESRQQLRTTDLNPHEGRLRASIKPIDVPDYPPESDTYPHEQ